VWAVLRNTEHSIGNLPDVRAVHWLPRILLAAIIIQQGMIKFPLMPAVAEGLGVPYMLYVLAAVGQLAAGAALIVGGFARAPFGDLLTRLGGFAVAAVTMSVLVVVYSVFSRSPEMFWAGHKLHLLLIVGGLYFAARGNRA